jgi:cytochrome c-type biogenesis protein CcsB
MIRMLPVLLLLMCSTVVQAQALEGAQPTFYEQLDLSPLDGVAVWQEGRLKSFESASRNTLNYISGPRSPGRLPHGVALLDLALRPAAWNDVDLHWVKKKLMRMEIIDALRESPTRPPLATDERLDRFFNEGLAPRVFLENAAVRARLAQLQLDVLRFARPVEEIDTSLVVARPEVLRGELNMVPPVGAGAEARPWRSLDDEAIANPNSPVGVAWSAVETAWQSGDALSVNGAIAKLAAALRQVNPSVYPAENRMLTEAFYFRMGGFSKTWMLYLLAVIPLLMWVIYRWKPALYAGYAIFLLAFALHTTAIFLRFYVAQRWPNTNMFEAVTTSTWFGGVFVVLLEPWVRRSPMAGLFVLGSAICSMVALMAAHLDPVHLNPNISNRMPVLHDVWLYIHTNVIIFSYVLIFLASVTGFLYLVRRVVLRLTRGKPDVGREWARAGGAGFLIVPRVGGKTALQAESTSFGQVLDGATMVLVELAMVLLWAGLAMGAIWADHSWGRPWGWDPKEVFALESFIIFAILIHIRLTSKDKGWWTALLAVIGCGAMLFNWIVINFTISGLHSYA